MNGEEEKDKQGDPERKTDAGAEDTRQISVPVSNYRKMFSICAFSLLVSYVIVLVLRSAAGYYIEQNPGSLFSSVNSLDLIVSSAVMYLVGMPVVFFVLRIIPRKTIRKRKLSAGSYVTMMSVAFTAVFVGNMIGNTLSALISSGKAENSLTQIVSENNVFTFVILVIVSPVAEELIFRKIMLDRLVVCGEKPALVFSALCFALYHMNLFQFFYAFGLGLIFGYAYLRTGRIRYSISLHLIVNLLGGVIAPLAVGELDTEVLGTVIEMIRTGTPVPTDMISSVLPGFIVFITYNIVFYGLAALGVVLFILDYKKIRFESRKKQSDNVSIVPVMLINSGMILFTVFSVIIMIKKTL